MATTFERFERIARRTNEFDTRDVQDHATLHPFDRRNIHPKLPERVRKLFDDGHCAEATFAALKFVDKVVQTQSNVKDTGLKLMMHVFDEQKPILRLNKLSSLSEVDEQKGFRFLFSGAIMAIRNPRGHEVNLTDDPDTCLDHLAFVSLLLRRLEESGFHC